MAINFDTSPYYDDYDETKGYYRILFKPGVSVQARELTQLQTALQKQVERVGNYFFRDGTRVFGAEFGYSKNFKAIKLQDTFGADSVDDYIDQLTNVEIIGETSGVKARVVTYTKSTDTDPPTIYVTYTQSTQGTGDNVGQTATEFYANEQIICEFEEVNNVQPGFPILSTAIEDHTADGQSASIETGVYFVKGHFVYTPAQRIIISKYTNNVSCRIGLSVDEAIVTTTEDDSLLDNAQGSPNFTASGADRYYIGLDLVSYGLDEDVPEDFIELQRINAGRQVQSNDAATNQYSEFERKMAQRAAETTGDYVLNQFDVSIRECLNDGTNNGVFDEGALTDSGNIADEKFLTMQISSGLAYISGFRVETIAPTFVDILKPRDYREARGQIATLEMGNYVRLENVYNLPDTTSTNSNITTFSPIVLRDGFTSTRGSAAGNPIGVARVRNIETETGSFTSTNPILSDDDLGMRCFIFDIKMFTTITLSNTAAAQHIVAGSKVTGAISGAYGFVNSQSTGGTLQLTSVVGNFRAGEALRSSASYEVDGVIENAMTTIVGGGTTITVASAVTHTFDGVKQLFQQHSPASRNFTSDIQLESTLTLNGSVSVSAGANPSLTGFNTDFVRELKAGDQIRVPTGDNGAFERFIVASVDSDTELSLTGTASNSVTSVQATRYRAFINDQEKNLALRKLSKDWARTLKTDRNNNESNTSLTVRREYYVQTDGNGRFNISGLADTKFAARSNQDYQISVIAAGDGTAQDGDIVNIESTAIDEFSGTNTTGSGLTVKSSSLFGDSAILKVMVTITKAGAESKIKDVSKAERIRVFNKKNWAYAATPDYDAGEGPMVYGTSAHHQDISLGVADVSAILAVYDSGTPGTVPVVPFLTFGGVVSGNFVKGELVRGQNSGAVAVVASNGYQGGKLEVVSINNVNFIGDELVEGDDSGAVGTVDGFTEGSSNVMNNFLLDTGQRDNFYDLSRLVYKPNVAKASGDLIVVFDTFRNGGGGTDFYSVDSYQTLSYKEIPQYSATRIDPEVRNADGLYDLRSSLDFRPKVADCQSTSVDADGNKFITGFTLDFESRNYTQDGASRVDVIKDNDTFQYDFEYYLSRISSVFLTSSGVFTVVDGYNAEDPEVPNDLNESMRIADIEMPPYVIDIEDVTNNEFNNKLYSMKDIQLLENRINNIEYYTAMTLLEKDAETMQIKDAYGLDRFKSGFLVDNFGGHKIGDTVHQDYRCSIDMNNRVLRPQYSMKPVKLVEYALSDPDPDTYRASKNYVVKDDMAYLPYTHVVSVEQKFGTRVENLNPVLSFFWEGTLKLSPSQDEWFKNTYLPSIRINVEGNYNTLLKQNKNALGTVWDAPVTNWSGVLTNKRGSGGKIYERTFANFVRGKGRRVLQRQVATEVGRKRQNGIQTSIVEQIDYKTVSNKIVGTSLIPYMREKTIYFEANGLKPYTRVYPFFDKIDVSKYVTQASGSYTSAANAASQGLKVQESLWNSISKIEVYYDNNSNAGFRMLFQTARDTDAEYGRKNLNEYWRTFGDKTITSGRTTDYGVVTFTRSSDQPVPNGSGDLYIRMLLRPTQIPSFRDHQIQISEIKFYDQDGVEISNTENAEVYSSRNFKNAFNVVDGTVNYKSDHRVFSEAWIKDNNRNSNIYWDYRINIRMTGGAFTIPTTSGNIRFVKSTEVDPGTLITDGSGHIAGIFELPDPNVAGNPKFQTGTRELRLTASPTNADSTETFATANYTATGILRTRQATIQATRNARIERKSVSRTTTVSRTVDAGLKQVGWYDPVAQSIMPQTEGGEFITKVEVYFSQKDGKIPVTCQIRTMENGTPTTTVLPDAEVTLEPEDVQVSNDGSLPTVFEFAHPIYVNANEEIAIVLISNSQKYLVWISRLGEEDAASGEYVSEQPYLGVLFKSQNNSTWTAYDLEDLKFKVYRASFDTAVQSDIELVNDVLPDETLVLNPLSMTAGSDIIRVYHQDHGMYGVGNLVAIDGATSGIAGALTADMETGDSSLTFSGVVLPYNSGYHYFRIQTANSTETGDEVVYGEITNVANGVTTVSNLSRGLSQTADSPHFSGGRIELYELNGIPLTEINTNHVVSNQGMDYYTITVPSNADETVAMGGSAVTASENAVVDAYQLMLPIIEYPETQIALTKEIATGTSPSGDQASFGTGDEEDITESERIVNQTPDLICSQVNEDASIVNATGNKSCVIHAYLTSTQENLSPVVDLERKSMIAYMNRINMVENENDVYPTTDYVPATAPEGDSNESVYITKRVQLKNPATAIRLMLDIVRNESADVQCMFKTLRSDDSTDFDEIGWTYFNEAGEPDTPINPVDNRTSFLEYEYTANEQPEFIAFAIKIRMMGKNGCEVPLIKNLRAIALAV
jgi:hypothetical protein